MWEYLIPELLDLLQECCGRPGVAKSPHIITEAGNKLAIPILQGAIGKVTITECFSARFGGTSSDMVYVDRSDILGKIVSTWCYMEEAYLCHSVVGLHGSMMLFLIVIIILHRL